MQKSIIIRLVILTALIMLLVPTAFSQKTEKFVFDANDVVLIPGLNAIVKADGKKLVVELMPPADHLPKEYKDVDLKKGDLIRMCNGKSVKSVEDLKAVLESVEIGEEISFGVKRDKDMMIVSFAKADPEAGGQRMMVMTQTIEGDDGEVNTDVMMGGEAMNNVIVLEAGLVIDQSEAGIEILAVMPMLKDNIEGELPQKGDLILAINGEKENSAETLEKSYRKIEDGQKVSLTIKRDKKEFMISFTKKPMDDGEVIIER